MPAEQIADVLAGRARWCVVTGDALATLGALPDGSVAHIVTDPPYGQSNEAYDRGVPAELWREAYRAAAEGAVLLSFAGGPTYHRLAAGIEDGGWRVRQMWAWVYRDGYMTSAWPREGFDRLAPAMDPICYATKGKVLLRLQREGSTWWQRKRQPLRPGQGYSARHTDHGTAEAAGHWPRTVVADEVPDFEYFALSRTSGMARAERCGHPNQKPAALMAWLLAKLPAGGVVLDPYGGSMTTGAMALAAGFRFIGVEQDVAFAAIGRRRLQIAQNALTPVSGLEVAHAV